jgi:hypothetical protein
LTPVDTSLTPVDTSQNSPHPTHNPLDGENEPTGTTVVSEVVSKNQLTPHEVFTLPLDSRIWVKFCGQELTPAIIYGGNDEVLRVGNHGDRIEPDWMLPIKLDDLAQGRISIYAA